MSDDRRHAMVVIALLGNPFSPRYARARRGVHDPLAFCAMNVAIHGPSGSLWALTERAVDPRARSADALTIGGSSMCWDGDRLVVDVRERTPWRRQPVEGRIVFTPHFLNPGRMPLDGDGKHSWWPAAPSGALEVRLSNPSMSFRGTGYHDSNAGDEPLEAGFEEWTWSRAHVPGGAVVTYDVVTAAGGERVRALRIGPRGATDVDGLVSRSLPRSRWGLARRARTSSERAPRIVRTLEDTPFYARDLVATEHMGREVLAMHETLSLERFARRTVQLLLPFRMRHA